VVLSFGKAFTFSHAPLSRRARFRLRVNGWRNILITLAELSASAASMNLASASASVAVPSQYPIYAHDRRLHSG